MSVLIPPIVPALRVAASAPDPGPSLHPSTTAQITRIEAAGGTLNQADTDRLDGFYSTLDTEGILTLLSGSNFVTWPPVGQTASPLASLLLDGFNQHTLTGFNITTGDWTGSGFQGDGLLYIDSNLAAVGKDQATYAFTIQNIGSQTSGQSVGGFNNADGLTYDPGNTRFRLRASARFRGDPSLVGVTYPLRVIVITHSGSQKVFLNGVEASAATSSDGFDSTTDTFKIFMSNNDPFEGIMSFAAYGDVSISEAQVASLDAAMTAFAP